MNNTSRDWATMGRAHLAAGMNCLHVLIIALLSAGARPVSAQSTLIRFDDLPTDLYYHNDGVHLTNTAAVPVPDEYNGLEWNNLYAVDGNHWPESLGQFAAGFRAAVISPVNEAVVFPNLTNSATGVPMLDNSHASAEIKSSGGFNLVSGYFTALYCDDLSLEVQGFNGSTLLYDQTYLLRYNSPSFIEFNFSGVTDVRLVSSGGVLADTVDGIALKTYALDDLLIAPVPEPAPLALGSLGALGLWALHHHRSGRKC